MSIKDILLKIKTECQNSAFLFNHKAKNIFPADFFTAIVIVFVGFAGFGLGRLSALEGKKTPVFIERNFASASLSSDIISDKRLTSDNKIGKAESPVKNPSEKLFVASKSGTKYYFPWCGTVSRIKEENKVWFASEAEAQKAGFAPATNCKGLK